MTHSHRNGNGRPADRLETIEEPGPKAEAHLGLVQWLHIGDEDAVAALLEDLSRLGLERLRTGVSWADYHRPQGKAWYEWLLPRLSGQVEVLPCFMYTPPSLGMKPKTSAPPVNPKLFADFLDVCLRDFGDCFEAVELWNEPTNPNHWDRALDPDWSIFCEMIDKAAYWASRCGKRTVLGGVGPADFDWFGVISQQGALESIDVVGVHALPGTWEQDTFDWTSQLEVLTSQLSQMGTPRPLWITETGYSTWQRDEYRQLLEFLRMADAPLERVYWNSAVDLDPDVAFADGWDQDERHFHFGLRRTDGVPKLLYRVLSSGGLDAARQFAGMAGPHGNGHSDVDGRPERTIDRVNGNGESPSSASRARAPRRRQRNPVMIAGGAGFIGTNLAARLLRGGERVLIYDNLSRPGVERNLQWLLDEFGSQVSVQAKDVRDAHSLRRAVREASVVFHLAAQVAVTTSLLDPSIDFAINAGGTLNVLEACRHSPSPPPVLFTSTNKVYGNLGEIRLRRQGDEYAPVDPRLRAFGVAEDRPLDFHSPYGCSKGVGDQYVLDYARSYRLPAVVFRMSCIYGPHQWGTEDQGWVAHFARQILDGQPITLYGDGFQVRDLLFVDDLIDAMLRAIDRIETLFGTPFNMGGGPANVVSLRGVIDRLTQLHGSPPELDWGEWRQGDQKYYVSDTRAFRRATGWAPAVGVSDGIEQLYRWLALNQTALTEALA